MTNLNPHNILEMQGLFMYRLVYKIPLHSTFLAKKMHHSHKLTGHLLPWSGVGVDVVRQIFDITHVLEIVWEPDFPATGGNDVAGAGPLQGSKVTWLHGFLED